MSLQERPLLRRKVTKMHFCLRHFPTKAFFVSIAALFFVHQIIFLAPIAYCRKRRAYRVQAVATTCASVTCLMTMLVIPLVAHAAASIYADLEIDLDSLFVQIALITQISDMITSTLILAAQICQRQRLARWCNAMQRVVAVMRRRFTPHFIDWQILVLFWLQMGFVLSEVGMFCSYIFTHGRTLTTLQYLTQFATVQTRLIAACYSKGLFAGISLILACYRQLEHSLKRLPYLESASFVGELMQLENSLRSLIRLFGKTFQSGILIMLIGNFINLLANMYAMLYYGLVDGNLSMMVLGLYCLKTLLELYAIIFVAHLCCAHRQRVKDLLLNSDYELILHRSYSLTHGDLRWPFDVEFRILGMFSLDHTFWLFLISYSANFVVIILQFGINKSYDLQQ